MAQDTTYQPIPFIYKSRGVVSRPELDRAPEYTYLDFLGCQERDEESVSSRYGQIIVNRDTAETGINNFFFTSPITTITRLSTQSNAWRYVGLQDGTLQRRNGTGQGAFTQIYAGLSGKLFDALITNCFQTSQAFIFIYDSHASIKDMGTGTPELIGIDPPPFTANAVPYSPLLTLIDNFATGNTYTTSGVSGWAFGSIVTLTATSGQLVTDFPEFFGIQQSGGSSYTPSVGSATASVTVTNGTNTSTSTSVTGFPSVGISPGQSINLTVNVDADTSAGGGTGGGSGVVAFEYSTDSGATWTSFFTWGQSLIPGSSFNLPAQDVSFSITGIANLNTLQFRVQATGTTGGIPPPLVNVSGTINSATATVSSASVLGVVAEGMLSILNTNSSINVPIVQIVSSGFAAGFYELLTITTQTAHGRAPGDYISIYGCSNDLVDGFYQVVGTPTSTTLTVYYNVAQGIRIGSAAVISALGGFLHGGAAAPSTCVLTNQYEKPYPSQISAWGFYQQVPTTTTSFPVSAWSGTVASNSTGTIGSTVGLDLSINNQVTDDDLIVVTLAVGSPANISNIRLQFDVAGSGFTSAYYYKDIAPAYYQGNVSNTVSAYQSTENQILADTLGLITGAPPNSTTAQLQPGNISTGSGSWVAVYLRRGNFLPVGNAGASGLDWSAITGWQIVVNTLNTGSSTVAVNGLYLQWGYGPSSFGGVGYDYRYTFYDANTGTESNPSPIQNFSTQFGYLSSLAAPFFLRQAVQVTGFYTTDPQVTHVRLYRRGGIYGDNWRILDQIPNNPDQESVPSLFSYKDTIPDAALAQAETLVLDNDPPVTSSLVVPINTTLSQVTSGPSSTIYSVFTGQVVRTASISTFVANQVVLVGNPNNLEIVTVIDGSDVFGAGNFSAVLRLQHNAGEPVIAYSVPRAKCNLCALAYEQVWLAGDSANPNRLYYSKKGQPENFGPQNYIDVSQADDIINAVINWRGTLIVGTLKSWFLIVGGATPYPQPTGSQHGIVAQGGWSEVEGAIWYRCLPDSESEALTREGWKSRQELVVGEEILAYDMTTQTCKWAAVEAINTYDYDGELMRIVGGKYGSRLDFSCTPNHTWVWRDLRRRELCNSAYAAHPEKSPKNYNLCGCGKPKSKSARSCQACSLPQMVRLRAANELGNSGQLVQASAIDASVTQLSPREAAILGWIVTDGSISKHKKGGRRAARIHQASTNRHASVIKELLGSDLMSIYSNERAGFNGGSVVELDFAMSTAFTERLLQKAGFVGKDDLIKIVCSLDRESALAMLQAMLQADGHGDSRFYQDKGPVLDAFRILAFMCGYTTNAPKYRKSGNGGKEHGTTHITRSGKLDCDALKKTSRYYKGKVWCPTTKFGTWVARSNGTISITGNSSDGLREFTGADGVYKSLPIEWVYRDNNNSLIPLADLTQQAADVMCYYQGEIYTSYISQNAGQRYRTVFNRNYERFRYDDVPATAMYWEKETNTFLVGKPVYSIIGDLINPPGTLLGYALVEDQVYTQDYDDGGWQLISLAPPPRGTFGLAQVPINMAIQHPYRDLGKPHFPKQWNMFETDVNTNGMTMHTTMLFDDGGTIPNLVLADQNTGTTRKKVQFIVTGQPDTSDTGSGQQAYRASIRHTFAVTVAPILYQEDIYAAVLADLNATYDTYWIKFNTDASKFVKQCYYDYTSPVPINVSLYADNNQTPYWTFTLPALADRAVQRVRFSNLNPGTTAFTFRTWRMIMLSTDPTQPFQLWIAPRAEFKTIEAGHTFQVKDLGMGE